MEADFPLALRMRDMQEGIDGLRAEVDRLKGAIEELIAERDRWKRHADDYLADILALRAALEHYKDSKHYVERLGWVDDGEIARRALEDK